MASYDFSSARLYADAPLHDNAEIALDANQSNYVRNVLRLEAGARLLTFNGRDGEWIAEVAISGKRTTSLIARQQIRTQTGLPDIWYVFAPLKHARLDYMVQKAVEMGVCHLQPVMTRRTQAGRVNTGRMQANVVEAAEQCGILTLASVGELRKLGDVLDQWPTDRTLVFCDESANLAHSFQQLAEHRGQKMAVLIGPEGGFDPTERERLLALPQALRLSLGPRILRADTAAVAALTLTQQWCGDWGESA